MQYQITIEPAATDKRHKIMKTFEINNETITIEKVGYGQYVLSGLSTSVHCTDSEINEILRPCAMWYCDYCAWEDNNILKSIFDGE